MADRPLWEKMHDAAMAHVAIHGHDTPGILAAMLRVVADQLFPEEPEPPSGEREPWPQAYQLRSDAMWEQRQIARQRLLDEVDRAEAGTENIQAMEEPTND